MKIKTLFQPKKATNLSGNITTTGAVTVINKGSATVDGQIIQPASIITNTINANELTTNNIQNNGNITTTSLSSNTISSNVISSSSLSTGDLTTNGMLATGDVHINGDLAVDGNSYLPAIQSVTIDNADTITTKNLNVTGSAHFFELIIDQIKAAGGSIIVTPADGFKIDDITFNGMYYTTYDGNTMHFENCPFLWFKATDQDNLNGNGRSNLWTKWDQAICADFNAVKAGSNFNVDNNSWWCMVGTTNNEALNTYSYADFMSYNSYSYAYTYNQYTYTYSYEWVNAEPKSVPGKPVWHEIYDRTTDHGELLETAYCHYIALLPYNPDGDERGVEEEQYSSWRWGPDYDQQEYYKQIGNDVAMLGHNWRDESRTSSTTNRRSAIYMSCYNNNLDSDLKPPFWAHYTNINDFTLDGRRLTKFDAAGGEVIGNFKVQAGNTQVDLDQYIKSLQDTNPMKLYARNMLDQDLTLIALQTNNENKITSLNNFPPIIAIKVSNDNTDINLTTDTNLNSLTLNLFGNDPTYGRNIDLKNWVTGTTTDNYNGIYVTDVAYLVPQIALISFGYRQVHGGQTISNTSITFSGQYTINPDTYDFSYNIPVIGILNAKGDDAELYRIVKKYEDATVDGDGDLAIDIKYAIQHIIGTNCTYPQPTSSQKLRITIYSGTGSIIGDQPIEWGSDKWIGAGYWEWTYTQTDWYAQRLAQRVMYVTVDLMDGNDILDTTLFNVQLSNTSLFSVKAGLTESIQANTTAINNETNDREIQYSSIMQTVTEIVSTVTDQQTRINGLTSYTYTNISEIDQKADRISLNVTSLQGDLNNLETGIRSTGIDIEDGKINLQADKVTFSNSDGTVNDKISIDPTTGTLNAENANISGIINANISYSPFIVLNENNATFNSSTNLYDLQLENYITGNGVSVASNFALWDGDPDYELNAILPEPYTDRNGMELTFVGIPQTRMPNGYVRISGSIMYDDGMTPYFVGATPIWPVQNTMIKMVNASFGYMAGWWITEGEFYLDNPATTNNPRLVSISNKTPATLPYKSITSNYTTTQFDTVIEAKSPNITITLNYLNANVGKTIMVLASFANGSININTTANKKIVNAGTLQDSIRLDEYRTLTFLWTGSMWWVFAHH